MAEPDNFDTRDRAHISIDVFRETAAYTFPSRNQERKPLRGDYTAHATQLLDQLAAALGTVPAAAADPRLPIQGLKSGTVVEVTTLPPAEDSRIKAVKVPAALEFPTQDVVILRSERNEDRTESALVFVPDDARAFLRNRIADYGRDPGNQRRPDAERFEVIEEVRAAEAVSLFTGEVDLAAPDILWWELWVRQPVALADRLVAAARNANIDVHGDRLIFPDTTVVFIHAVAAAVAAFAARVPGAITEIRRATGTIEPFLDRGETGLGQHDWVEELAQRVSPPSPDAPVVCTLDTGVMAAHPLIAPGLRGAWAYDPAWGADDHQPHGGHGTPLAGLVLYGDLEPLMNDERPVELTHGAESMKLLPPGGFPPTKPPSYGVVTQGAVSSVEIERPNVMRSFCIATSATDFPPSRPSTWSGAIDQIAAGAMPGEADDAVPAAERPKRLIVVATGNVSGGMAVDVLPSQPLEDPSQSWNALTIGGFTRKEQPPAPPPVLQAAVPANHRSPFSRGSQSLPDDLTRPDTYRSFGLRFDMKKRTETAARFRSRISASQAKDGTEADGGASCWLLGPKAIQAGSLHCDLWRGRAIELAGHDAIAVYPVGGWWKSHVGQKRVADKARYALVISISAPGQDVDLYSEISTLVENKEIEVLLG